MTFWSRLKGLVHSGKTAASAGNSESGVRWVSASENPFGVRILDCRSLSQSMLAVTQDPKVAESFGVLRASNGEQYRGRSPEDSETCVCDLRYSHKGNAQDGPVFKAKSMEDKWDIYLYDGHLYFARSWTGGLEYRATIEFDEDGATVNAVEARAALVQTDPFYPIAVVDYLIRSHLYRLPVPHPLPKSAVQDPWRLALFSFSQYGRYALFGTFADTTQLRMPRQENGGDTAV
jgi:hypothetical protein